MYYDQAGRIAYVPKDQEAHYQTIGYTAAPAPAPVDLAPAGDDKAKAPKAPKAPKSDQQPEGERPAKDI